MSPGLSFAEPKSVAGISFHLLQLPLPAMYRERKKITIIKKKVSEQVQNPAQISVVVFGQSFW